MKMLLVKCTYVSVYKLWLGSPNYKKSIGRKFRHIIDTPIFVYATAALARILSHRVGEEVALALACNVDVYCTPYSYVLKRDL